MATVEVKCPVCGQTKVYKYGRNKNGEQLKKRRKNIPYLTTDEIAAIKSVLIGPASPLSLRDKAIGLLALETGLRCCDIVC